MRRYAVIGTGSVGGFIAAKLAQADVEVHCLLRSDYDAVKAHGLTLIDANNNRQQVNVHAYANTHNMPACDVVLVTLKATENHLLPQLLPPLLHDKTKVVLMQNGIGEEQQLANYIDAKKIIGANCLLKVEKIAPGTIKHYGFSTIVFAQYFNNNTTTSITAATEKIVADFVQAGFNAEADEHLPTVRWKKICANVPINGLSVVLNSKTRDLVSDPSALSAVIALTKECYRAAIASGANLSPEWLQQRTDFIQSAKYIEAVGDSLSSTKIDFDNNRPIELEAIFLNPIKIAHQHKCPMPRTQLLYDQLCYLSSQHLKSS